MAPTTNSLDWRAAEAQQVQAREASELLALSVATPAASGDAGMDPAVFNLVLDCFQKQNLEATAACFRQEAGNDRAESLADLPSIDGAPFTPEDLSRRYRTTRASNGEGRHRVESCGEVMIAQRRRLEAVGKRLQEILVEYERVIAAAGNGNVKAQTQDVQIRELQNECSSKMAHEDTLREKLNRKEDEARELRKCYETQKAVEAELWAELTQLQAEAPSLRQAVDAANAHCAAAKSAAKVVKAQKIEAQAVHAAPPTPLDEGQITRHIIHSVLSCWDSVIENKEIFACFAEADSDRDGKLSWNTREIVTFVSSVFHHHGLEPPSWPEHVWYEIFRSDDLDQKHSLDIHKALKFAKHCFQLVGRAMDADHTHTRVGDLGRIQGVTSPSRGTSNQGGMPADGLLSPRSMQLLQSLSPEHHHVSPGTASGPITFIPS